MGPRILLVAWLALSMLACSPSAPTTVHYAKDGIAFSHPSNWKITLDEAAAGRPGARTIHLEGPGQALVAFLAMPSSPSLPTLGEFASSIAKERAKAIKDTLSIGSVSAGDSLTAASQAVTARIGGVDQAGLSQRFSVVVLGQEVPHEARFFLVDGRESKVFIIAQVSNDSAAAVAPAMAAALDSFKFGAPN